MFAPIGGAVGLGVGLGQLALGEAFRIGALSIRHVGIVVAPGEHLGRARLVQAMPSGAEEIALTPETHWTPRHAYVRLPEDYPGQGEAAAAIARLMVQEGVAYSFASYGALALWRWGVKTPRLERWIARRRTPEPFFSKRHPALATDYQDRPMIALPVEAICSVLVDQAWSLAGKRVVHGTAPQVVSPGKLASSVFATRGVVWGGAGLL